MTPEQQDNLKEVISRYISWYNLGVVNYSYYRSKTEWEKEIEQHIKNLESKLKINK